MQNNHNSQLEIQEQRYYTIYFLLKNINSFSFMRNNEKASRSSDILPCLSETDSIIYSFVTYIESAF